MSRGITVILNVDVIYTPPNQNENTDIYWEKQGNETSDFQTLPYRGKGYFINGATEEHSGVYYAYWKDWRNAFTGSFFRLIVRSCGNDKWGPSCTGICDNCYNGGICDDKTGECVCRPGFMGPNCVSACGENKFGWDCEHQCGSTVGITSCSGSVFCMPDPVGCSCMTGWMGTECNQECPLGMYGAGCTQFCRCQSGSCDRFTGRCDDGMCLTGWSGDNCQSLQDDGMRLTGWSGDNCQKRCDDGMRLTGWSGDNCQRGCDDGMCLTGWSDDNCQSLQEDVMECV
ncbi:tyrosine-protein kinase receptor Tie-1-like [Amphiura filiformis]|uniref:tyrosine-protein kinase receptor Tie-1-like n=1 Tax=Amphiura filiformis TaxID=82378 RepID=UPI003B224472